MQDSRFRYVASRRWAGQPKITVIPPVHTSKRIAQKRSVIECSGSSVIRHPDENAWIGAVGVALLFVLLRWNNYDAPLIRDEGEFAYAAQLLKHGMLPYEHSFLQKPPMAVYSYALASAVAPQVFWAPRLVAYLFAALATGLLGWIIRLEFGKGFALPTIWLVTPMLLLPALDQTTAITEVFMLLPLLGTLACYVWSRQHRGWPAAWLCAGALGAITLCYKYTALPLIGFVFCAWLVEERGRGTPFPKLCRYSFLALVGAAIAAFAVLGLFLIADGGARLWECTVAFNRYYVSSSNFGLSRVWSKLLMFWSHWQILFLLLPLVLFRPKPRVWVWVAMLLAACLTTGGSYYSQYYITIMPFWAVLSVLGIKRLSSWLAERVRWPENWLSRGLTALVVTLLCLPALAALVPGAYRAPTGALNSVNPFQESMLVARRVAQLTSPQDYVFVAGSEPQILSYSHRFSPTRFIIAYPMMIPSPLARGYQEEAIHDLQRHPPAVVVRARWNTSWLAQAGTPAEFLNFLDKMLADNYEPVGGYVLDGQAGHWLEPLGPADIFRSSLVLYRRKVTPVVSLSPNAPGRLDRPDFQSL